MGAKFQKNGNGMSHENRSGGRTANGALIFIASYSLGLLLGMTMFALLRAFVG